MRKVMLGVESDNISGAYDILHYSDCVYLSGFSRFGGVTIHGVWIGDWFF
jgi:hypothetical protein